MIERFNLVVKFLQQKGRLIHAKGVVKQRREEFCENSRERRQPLVSLITERLLAPYSWLDSSTLENAENEVTLRRIANTFQIESNPISEVLPSPPSSSIPVPQYSFLPYSPPPSHNGSDSTFCRERPFVHSSHWAQELFQLLDLPKSTFGSQVDLTNSQYLLIKSNASDNESQKYTSSHERLDLDSVILSHSDPWNQSYTTPDMLPRYGGFGDIHTSTDGHRINLQKYTQLSNVGAAIPPVFQVIKEKYSL